MIHEVTNKQILATVAVLVISTAIFELSHIDLPIQNHFYDFQAHRWIVDRDESVPRLLFYEGIKKVFIGFVLLVLAVLVVARWKRYLPEYRSGLLIVLLSTIAVPLAANGLKALTNVPCPRDIVHFNGGHPYVTLLTPYPEGSPPMERIRCFPAGHASGGFSLLALFFLFKTRRARTMALIFGMAIGWTVGIYKMTIGDHFLSHTVFTMILAWLIILIIARCVGVYAKAGSISTITGHTARTADHKA
ncbi:MAG: phosphoesterase PA-phosphatase-like protein [Gammaproteobacteria bacterium]|nr:MAG: phosphoesterase PA-phosphatase-like protein [Gammaproteobacteria bacterium]TND01755.1 MAG: phosphoesterase PA-phosphatase-like protein [Gammaproteobacteria bacterium]